MPNIDLDDRFVFHKELTVQEIRDMDDALTEKVEGWLDEAQGPVFIKDAKKTYLVIEVS